MRNAITKIIFIYLNGIICASLAYFDNGNYVFNINIR